MIGRSTIVRALRGLGLSRQAARFETRTMGYDGAAGGRRLRNAGVMPSPIASQITGRQPLAHRARYLAANNGFAAAGVNALVSGIAGSGFVPRSTHPDPEVRKSLQAAWTRWAREADADGRVDFCGILEILVRRIVIDGDIFILFVLDSASRLRLRLLDADQISGAYSHSDVASGGRVVSGIEFDAAGNRIAYHSWRQRPGLPIMPAQQLVRLPAEDVLHVFKVTQPGQVRGVSSFAPILLRLASLDISHDAQLERQKVASLMVGFIVDPNGEAGGFDGEADGKGSLDVGMEPGTLKTLLPGQDIRISEAADIGDGIQFLKVTAKEIAAGLGVPYEELSGDRSEGNYSSMRDGKIEFRRRCEAIQFNVLVHQFCDPVWRRWVTTEVLSGRLDAPGFATDPEPYLGVQWLPPKNDWVDPLRDAQAEILAINAGLMSRRQAVAARGYDLEQLDAEIAQDRADAERLGLHFDTNTTPPAPAQSQGATA